LSLWKARKSSYATLARASHSFVLDDVTVPISRIPDLLVGIQGISQKYGLTIATYGHAGYGNLHPQILMTNMTRSKRKGWKKWKRPSSTWRSR